MVQNNEGMFFIDGSTRDFYIFGDPPKSLSNELGFKTWANQNLQDRNEYNLREGIHSQTVHTDLVNDAIYINSGDGGDDQKSYSLCFNNRLKQFESFFSHEGIPFMFNFFGKFISVMNDEEHNTVLWYNNEGEYGNYYDEDRLSKIVYYMNPDPLTDKVFDNIGYSMDVFEKNGIDEYGLDK